MTPRRSLMTRFLRLSFLACALGAVGSAALAQQPLRLVLGYPPGGSNDITARIIAPRLGAELGVNVIIENKAGANGTVGADHVAKAAPDGNTLLLISSSPLVIAPHVIRVPFDTVRDFAPVNQIGLTPEAIEHVGKAELALVAFEFPQPKGHALGGVTPGRVLRSGQVLQLVLKRCKGFKSLDQGLFG